MADLVSSYVVRQDRGRKRQRNTEDWAKSKKKRERYSSKGNPSLPDCGHASKSFKCMSLTKRDVNHFHKMFYSSTNKVVQDHLILKYCSIITPQKSRQKKENSSRKGMSVTYFVKKATHQPGIPDKVPVCQKTFMTILGIKKTRVQNVCKKHLRGVAIKENRGGDTRSSKSLAKREAIDKFLGKVRVIEQHYCRGRSKRQYLSSDLNINKLWRLYNSSCENPLLKTKKSFFRNYVNLNFNIGFGAPAVDACSTCIQLKEQLKLAKTNGEKVAIMTKKRIHSLRSKAFFEMLGENSENVLNFSYDCQKNQVLPKVPDQKAYYSRQLYCYNFTVVEGSSHDKLTKDNVFSYVWFEHEYPKGSNEIASAVFHALKSRVINPDVRKVRLFADGCGGQNKNSMIIGMASKWLLEYAPKNVLKVELIFPVVGHSFMPPDRVFALMEREIKKKDTIILPQEYKDIISKYATVIELGHDCPVLDWKPTVSEVQKPPGSWHFQFNPSKRFILSRNKQQNKILVRGESLYRSDTGKPMSVTKKDRSVYEIRPNVIVAGNYVKAAKLKDVAALLESHFGDKWKEMENLGFYVDITGRQTTEISEDIEEDQECAGGHIENDKDLRV